MMDLPETIANSIPSRSPLRVQLSASAGPAKAAIAAGGGGVGTPGSDEADGAGTVPGLGVVGGEAGVGPASAPSPATAGLGASGAAGAAGAVSVCVAAFTALPAGDEGGAPTKAGRIVAVTQTSGIPQSATSTRRGLFNRPGTAGFDESTRSIRSVALMFRAIETPCQCTLP